MHNDELAAYRNYCFLSGVEELWSGITFDHVEQKMSWKSSCQVNAVISLCEMQDEDVCQDLANSSQRYVKGMVSACIKSNKYIKVTEKNIVRIKAKKF